MTDVDGETFPLSIVKPVSERTEATSAGSFAQGGNNRINERRRTALRPWLRDMVNEIKRAGQDGLALPMLGKFMASRPGFTQALKDQRATLSQIVALFPEIRVERSRGQVVLFSNAARPRPGSLDAFT